MRMRQRIAKILLWQREKKMKFIHCRTIAQEEQEMEEE